MRETKPERAENSASLPNCAVMHFYAKRLLAAVSAFDSQHFRFSRARAPRPGPLLLPSGFRLLSKFLLFPLSPVRPNLEQRLPQRLRKARSEAAPPGPPPRDPVAALQRAQLFADMDRRQAEEIRIERIRGGLRAFGGRHPPDAKRFGVTTPEPVGYLGWNGSDSFSLNSSSSRINRW
jgi:hypothetical protein